MIKHLEFGSFRVALNLVRGLGMYAHPSPHTDLAIEAPQEMVVVPSGVVAYAPSKSLHDASCDDMISSLFELGWTLAEDHHECCGLPFGDPGREDCQSFDTPQMGVTADGGYAFELIERATTEPPTLEIWLGCMTELADSLGVTLR